MGKAERRKGHDFERKIARRFRELFPESKRGFQTRGGTAEEPDVIAGPFAIECKHGKRPNIRAAYEQARSAPGVWPIAITRKDRDVVLVTMGFDDFFDLIAEWQERGE